ncbi:MAG: RibD family protein, partial [Burkholderiales bacterium]
IGTVRADDPRLTVRDAPTSRQPLRIVVDSRMTIGPQANVLAGGGALVVAAHEDTAKAATLRAAGSETLVIPGADGQVDLAALMAELGARAMNEIHVEAGPILNGALLRERLADEILLYFAPSLLGDRARGMFDLPELSSLGGRHALDLRDVRRIGADLRILARMLVPQ